jgi:APA family basic amino acid/polyamine antiporter
VVLDPGLTAARAAGLAQYLVVLWPEAIGEERWLAAGAIWSLSLVSMSGLTVSARVLDALTTLKVLALAGLVAAAFTVGDGSWAHFAARGRVGAPPIGEALALGLVGVFFSFGGFWEASRLAGEIRNPNRVLPRALALGVAVVTGAYVATSAAFVYLVPVEQATSATELARLAGTALFGARGPSVLAAIVVLSVVASMMALLMMAPRLYVAMGRDGLFPVTLASAHARNGAPVNASAVLCVLATAYVLAGTFQDLVAFFLCTALGFVALAAAALFVVRKRPAEGVFRTPGYPVSVAVFVLLVAIVVAVVAISRPVQAFAGFALVLLGVPAHGVLVSRGVLAAPRPSRVNQGVPP